MLSAQAQISDARDNAEDRTDWLILQSAQTDADAG